MKIFPKCFKCGKRIILATAEDEMVLSGRYFTADNNPVYFRKAKHVCQDCQRAIMSPSTDRLGDWKKRAEEARARK